MFAVPLTHIHVIYLLFYYYNINIVISNTVTFLGCCLCLQVFWVGVVFYVAAFWRFGAFFTMFITRFWVMYHRAALRLLAWFLRFWELVIVQVSSMSVSVTFGRNIGGRKMRRADWRLFQDLVVDSLARLFPDGVIESKFGVGVWDGVREQSCRVTVYGLADVAGVGVLRDELAYLARIFCQDAIALTVGNDYLVEAD